MTSTNRERLSSNLVKSVKFHFSNFSPEQIAGFTVQRSKSSYPHAKTDLIIFDGSGTAVIKGREFGGRQTTLWL
jgi:hypothetical protein